MSKIEEKELKQQLMKKDKEIKRLKNLFKLNNEVVINQGQEIFDLRVQVLQQKQNQAQLAIQELEKVRSCCENYALELDKCKDNETNNEIIKYLYIISEIIDNQIKKLKGE